MSARKKMPVPADVARAKGYIDRVRNLIEQQKELGGDIADVCSEAKENAGLDPTVIRFVAREMLMDQAKRRERDEKREQYLHAVGLAVAAVQAGEVSAREAAKIYGIGKSSVYKALAVREVSTVEMVEGDLGTFDPPREMLADDLGAPDLLHPKRRDDVLFRERVRRIASEVRLPRDPAPVVVIDDDLTPPAFLRRERATA